MSPELCKCLGRALRISRTMNTVNHSVSQDNMVTCTEELTSSGKDALKKFRSLVSNITKPEHQDGYLLRWLRDENWNPERAADKFRAHCKWRREYGIDTILNTWIPPDHFKPLSYFDYVGFAKDGSAVWIVPFGHWDPKDVLSSMNLEDLVLNIVYLNERTMASLAKHSEKVGRYIWKQTLIMDAENIQYSAVFYRAAWKVAIRLAKLTSDHFPDVISSMYIINSSSFATTAFSIIRPLLHKCISSKLKVYGTDRSTWVPALLEVIEPDQLPAYWGGTQVDPKDGDPRCPSKVCFRYKIHQSLYIKNKLSSIKKQLSNAVVKHGGILTVSKIVKISGSKLRWSFYSDGRDIDFYIRHQLPDGTEETIVETLRVECFFTLVEGQVICKKSGLYKIGFDNSYFRLRSKSLHYSLEVTLP